MKIQASATLLSLLGVAHATAGGSHAVHARHAVRQVAAVAGSASSDVPAAVPTAATSAGAAAGAPVPPASVSGAAPPPPATPTPVVLTTTLFTTGTAIPPLSQISSGMASESALPVTATYTPGAHPSQIKGAPALPAYTLKPTEWPALDKHPDTTSPQVQKWMKELVGWDIPDLDVTTGECGGSPAAAADAQARGWWTCGGWTAPTDISVCPNKYDWGVSFDDGPSPYTQKLLNYLSEKDILATFFVVGSRCLANPQLLLEEYMAGHEISVHTWSHPALTSMTNEQIVAELGWTREIIKTITGVTPTTMRAPFGDIDNRVRAIALAMGLTPIQWTRTPSAGPFDTNDWRVAAGTVAAPAQLATFEAILGNASTMDTGFVVLQHDLYEVTVDLAVGYTLDAALSHQPPFSLKPIGTCQGWPASDLYLETTTNKTFPYANSTAAQNKSTGSGGLQAAGASTSGGAAASGNGTVASSGAALSAGAGLPATMALALAGLVAACGLAF